VSLGEAVVEVHRDPTAMPQARYGWHYRAVERFGPADAIAALSFPHTRIAVADLLP